MFQFAASRLQTPNRRFKGTLALHAATNEAPVMAWAFEEPDSRPVALDATRDDSKFYCFAQLTYETDAAEA
jgi:hypothetical protein